MKVYPKKKRRSFSGRAKSKSFRKALLRVLFILYLLTVLPLLASYLSQLISPAGFWPLAFFGPLYLVLMAFQFVFLVLFLILKHKAIVFPILVILIGWGALSRSFQVPLPFSKEAPATGTIKVMTYNVRLFDIVHYWSRQKDPSVGIFAYINEVRPDILCLQEFAHESPGNFSLEFIRGQIPYLPSSVVEYNFTFEHRKHGLAIFSKYPILSSGHEHFQDTRNMMLYADVLIGTDTVRIFNNHLESIHFDRDEFKWIDTTSNKGRIPRDKVTEIINRMKRAYIKRATQAESVRSAIDESPHPVIVCGDFNDTPVSYATHRIGSNLTDSFRSGGRWMGITFPNIKAPLRIDYILHSRELPSFDYRIGNVMHSDHKPVSCVIAVGR